jgi:hypothetical protein
VIELYVRENCWWVRYATGSPCRHFLKTETSAEVSLPTRHGSPTFSNLPQTETSPWKSSHQDAKVSQTKAVQPFCKSAGHRPHRRGDRPKYQVPAATPVVVLRHATFIGTGEFQAVVVKDAAACMEPRTTLKWRHFFGKRRRWAATIGGRSITIRSD